MGGCCVSTEQQKGSKNLERRTTKVEIAISQEEAFLNKSLSRMPSSALGAPEVWVQHLLLSGVAVDADVRHTVANAIGSVHYNFPGAMPDRQIVTLLTNALKKKIKYWSVENTLLGTSFCPDEISNEKGDLPQLLHEMFGKVFPFSGLAGVPFAGRTGFKAFASHVPKNGTVLIVYGPHVSISPDGIVGKFKRPGQDHLTSACGACIGALSIIEKNTYDMPSPGSIEYEEDFQMNYIIQELKARLEQIIDHPKGKQVGLVFQAFKVAQKLIRTIIDVDVLDGAPVILLGGIQINMPDPLPDFYLPQCFRRFTIENKEGESWLDMLGGGEKALLTDLQ